MYQIVCCLRLFVCWFGIRIEHMKSDVAFDHLSHQGIHSTPASGDVVQNIGTLRLLVKRPFDGIDLTSNAANPVQQFLFFI